jgi:hypothetical protein
VFEVNLDRVGRGDLEVLEELVDDVERGLRRLAVCDLGLDGSPQHVLPDLEGVYEVGNGDPADASGGMQPRSSRVTGCRSRSARRSVR